VKSICIVKKKCTAQVGNRMPLNGNAHGYKRREGERVWPSLFSPRHRLKVKRVHSMF